MNRRRHRRLFTWFRLGLLGVGALAAGSLYTPYPAKLVRALRGSESPKTVVKRVKVVETKEVPSEPEVQLVQAWHPENAFHMPAIELPPFPPALPERVEPGTYTHDNSLMSGVNLRSVLNFKPGTTAAADRKKPEAYRLRVEMDLLQPHAANGDELKQANPDLPAVLAGYDALMQRAQVSPWFTALYQHKENRIRKQAATLDRLMDCHNYYDTDTMLQITAPSSGRKLLWMQADMDVVSDGSDGDRLPNMPDKVLKSDNYQPTTSYRWKKVGNKPNPLLAGWEARYEKLKKDKNASKDALENAKARVWELKNSSFLLAEYDPFIVVPLVFKQGKDASYRPQAGDYAVVVVGKDVYPALVGDFGPDFKTGEASLRLAKMVNPRATTLVRPVSDLKVSYLIFPNSKEPQSGPPDYARLNTRCRQLLDELGGLGPEAQFHEVQDLLAPPPAQESGAPAAH